jgi:hypothetical protein
MPAGRIVLADLQRAERHAVGDLLARPIVTDRATVDLAELDQLLAHRSPYRPRRGPQAAPAGLWAFHAVPHSVK